MLLRSSKCATDNRIKRGVFFALIAFIAGVFILPVGSVRATIDTAEINRQIQGKASELTALNEQIKRTQAEIDMLNSQQRTLNRDIKQFDYEISQLSLNIRASEISIEKLTLELNELGNEKGNIETSLVTKQSAIGDVLRQMQQDGDKGLIYTLLKNDSLSDSVFEMQSLFDLQSQLSLRVRELSFLHGALTANISSTEMAVSDVESAKQDLASRKQIVDDKKQSKKVVLTESLNKEGVYQEQLAELEKKQKEIENTIADIEAKLRAAFDPSVLPKQEEGTIGAPLTTLRVTQCYGKTAFAATAYKSGIHNGLDLGTAVGTRVYATADGIVRHVDNNDASSWKKYQYGRYVLIDHGDDLSTLYAHLSSYVVSSGESVKRGQLIGYSGNTGYSTGAHLHFGLYSSKTVSLKSIPPAQGVVPVGVTVNPAPYMPSGVGVDSCR